MLRRCVADVGRGCQKYSINNNNDNDNSNNSDTNNNDKNIMIIILLIIIRSSLGVSLYINPSNKFRPVGKTKLDHQNHASFSFPRSQSMLPAKPWRLPLLC